MCLNCKSGIVKKNTREVWLWGKADMLRTNPAIVGNVIFGVTNKRFVALEKINATTC